MPNLKSGERGNALDVCQHDPIPAQTPTGTRLSPLDAARNCSNLKGVTSAARKNARQAPVRHQELKKGDSMRLRTSSSDNGRLTLKVEVAAFRNARDGQGLGAGRLPLPAFLTKFLNWNRGRRVRLGWRNGANKQRQLSVAAATSPSGQGRCGASGRPYQIRWQAVLRKMRRGPRQKGWRIEDDRSTDPRGQERS